MLAPLHRVLTQSYWAPSCQSCCYLQELLGEKTNKKIATTCTIKLTKSRVHGQMRGAFCVIFLLPCGVVSRPMYDLSG